MFFKNWTYQNNIVNLKIIIMVKELTGENFSKTIKDISEDNGQIIKNSIIEFYLATCPHCMAMVSIYEDISEEFPDIDFYRIEISDNMDIAHKFNIEATPTFIFFPVKCIYRLVVGAMSKTDFKEKLKEIFKL